MKVIHRISLATTPTIRRELAELGVVVGDGFVTFDLSEEDESWPALTPKLAAWQAVDVPSTKFTANELRAARWLQMTPQWHHGYPQPNDDSSGYLAATYDVTNRCAQCGVGAVQNAPFRMAGEPKWGRRGMLQLNWIFGEYFSTPRVWEESFKPLGVASQPVLNSAGNSELKTVVQLLVPETVNVEIAGCESTTCDTCGSPKYLPVAQGMFPTIRQAPRGHLTRTSEFFGSGASASRPVLASRAVFSSLQEHKTKGVGWVPVSPDDGDLSSRLSPAATLRGNG